MNYIVLNKDIHGQVGSLTLPIRDYKSNSVFSEAFFQGSLKFRNLDLLLYFVQQEAELALFWADYGKMEEEKKMVKEICLLSLSIMKNPDSENSLCQGKQKGTFTFRKGENWAHPYILKKTKKQIGITRVSGSISSNKKVHQQHKKVNIGQLLRQNLW